MSGAMFGGERGREGGSGLEEKGSSVKNGSLLCVNAGSMSTS